MNIITRIEAINNLKKYIGKDLSQLAKQYNVTTYETGKQNKGWKGLVLERLACLDHSNAKAPNGLSFELKSVAFYNVKDKLVPKETMAITMINPEELRVTSFFESHCWQKLKALIFCAVFWHGKNAEKAELIEVTSFDFSKNDELVLEIAADYDLIRDKLITNGFGSLTGKDGTWIQARTKGSGHGSISRAFYARKNLINKIFKLSES